MENIPEAIQFINKREKPLALYLFSDSKQETNQVLDKVSAGGVCINDTVMHLTSPYLPFGGVGGSGYGAYHGKFGFDIFSHHKTVLKRSFWFDMLFKYPPYLNKLSFFKKLFKFISVAFILSSLSITAHGYEWNQVTERGVVNKIATENKTANKDVVFSEIDVKTKVLTALEVNKNYPSLAKLQTIVIIGDTGCRLKAGKFGGAYQDCNDSKVWPFYKVVEQAEKENPDLIIHLGDYHYRESCTPGSGCEKMSSVIGYGWKPWEQDFFHPMINLFLKAPIVIVRGNHEDCDRAYVGYKKLLSNLDWDKECLEYEPAQVLVLGDTAIVNFDSSSISEIPLMGDENAWVKRLNDINEKLESLKIKKAWLVTHKPIYGLIPFKSSLVPGLINFRNYFEKSLLKDKISAVFAGHIHTSMIVTAPKYAKQVVLGNGGSLLDKINTDLITPRLLNSFSYTSADLIDSGFGYALLKKVDNKSWEIIFKNSEGVEIARKPL